jgi:cell division transport system permease protein
MAKQILRPAKGDDLGLARVLPGRLLPVMIAVIAALAVIALSAAAGSAALAGHWRNVSSHKLTIELPAGSAITPAALAGIGKGKILSTAEIGALLAPWLGGNPQDLSLQMPQIVEIEILPGQSREMLAARITHAWPNAVLEGGNDWAFTLARLGNSLKTSAGLAALLVLVLALSVVLLATHAGLVAGRETLEIVHALGATDAQIARRYASRIAVLAARGATAGTLLALPPVLAMTRLAAPLVLAGHDVEPGLRATLVLVPGALWLSLAAMPVLITCCGYAAAFVTVRNWLMRLP